MSTRLADAMLGCGAAVLAALLAPWWCAMAWVFLAAALVYRAARSPRPPTGD